MILIIAAVPANKINLKISKMICFDKKFSKNRKFLIFIIVFFTSYPFFSFIIKKTDLFLCEKMLAPRFLKIDNVFLLIWIVMRKNKWIEFDLLKKHTSVCSKSYLRHGGFSKKPYDSLNLGTSVGDNYENVKKNRELIKNELNAGKIIFANQVHGKEIVEITKKNVDEAFNVDGFYTKEKNIALAILHADCQAALFFDPIQKIIGAVHAGWRGLMLNFYKEMIDIFIKKENSNHKNILVCKAPSICHKHSVFIN